MENKRLLIVAVLLIFSIVMIFAYDKMILKRQNKKEATNQQPLLPTISMHSSVQDYAINGISENEKIIIIKQLAETFLTVFNEEEYLVVAQQRPLFTRYEKFLSQIILLPIDRLDPTSGLILANALFKGANIYRRLGDTQSQELAKKHHQIALKIREKFLDPKSLDIANSLMALGAAYNESRGKENCTKALQYFKKALNICETNKENGTYCTARVLYMLGNTYRDLGNIKIGVDYLDNSLGILSKLPQTHIIQQTKAIALFNQGANHHHLGGKSNMDKAVVYLNKAKELFELENDQSRLAITLSYLGGVYRCLGKENLNLSIEHLNRALNIQRKLYSNEEHVEYSVTLFYLGLAYYDLPGPENSRKAIEYLKDALNIQQKLLKNHSHIVRTMYNLGIMQLAEKNFDSGFQLIQEALVLFKSQPESHYYFNTAIRTFEQVKDILAVCNYKGAKELYNEMENFDL